TTIKMLTGILHPTVGEARVAGFSPQRERTRVAARIGAVFGQRTQLWWDLPLRDSIELLAAMYDVSPERYRAQMQRLDAVLGIGELLAKPVRKLSLGQRMRADLAAALLHDPAVLFLDEPTIGLDVIAKERVRTFLQELRREAGVTILLTTHDLNDIEQLCERVLVINHGRLVFDGTTRHLRGTAGVPSVLTLEYAAPPAPEAGAPFQVLEREGSRLVIGFDRARQPAGEVIAALSRFGEVRDVHIDEPDLEEIIRRLYAAGARPA
ncbi:MAG TPA: ATP-binding cassette domain-containing protein, partial [Limnochordia bacterium]|nr:ATP-binding cassette domain-containing protein [Limnochordia bacterium]